MRSLAGRGSRVHDEIDHGQEMLMLTEIFADPALDAITVHRAASRAHTHCEAEPRVTEAVHFRRNQE